MIKVGYIDDAQDQFENYQRKLRRCDIELVAFAVSGEKAGYVDQIYQHQAEALLIDYNMVGTLGYNGSALISYISDVIPDITCFILTSVETTHITDKLVSDGQIYSKDVFDTEADNSERMERFQAFVEHLKNCAEVFQSRRNLKCEEYEALLRKKRGGQLSVTEEEEFCRLYRCLSSYGMVERLPERFLRSDFEQKLDDLLQKGEALLQKR